MSNVESAQLVVFSFGRTRFAFRVESVDEVVPIVALGTLPDHPRWLLGTLTLSGEIVPVADLAGLLSLDIDAPDLDARIIIARRGGGRVGLLVRSDVRVLDVPTAALRVPRAVESHARGLEMIAETVDGAVLVLDLDMLIPDLAVLS